jgi:hypothetical protein
MTPAPMRRMPCYFPEQVTRKQEAQKESDCWIGNKQPGSRCLLLSLSPYGFDLALRTPQTPVD